jgi:hypothetical protein
LKSISISEGPILHDQAIESREEASIQLRSCSSAAPNGKKNFPVDIGGNPAGAGIETASHIDEGVEAAEAAVEFALESISVDISLF